jgi:hypothetical protein
MPFARQGMGFQVFCKFVKTMKIKVIDGRGTVLEADLPLQFFRAGIGQIQVSPG